MAPVNRPRLLDLFCGAGGAGMGYHRAGFDVVGIDKDPQPNYPFQFHQLDVMKLDPVWFKGFQAVHASPPCQHYSVATPKEAREDHPDLLGPVRALLGASERPWVIESVPGAPGPWDLMLCGSTFGLPLRRHRYFQLSEPPRTLVPPCWHREENLAFKHRQERLYADMMGCRWMTKLEAREAIPPAYTEFVGGQLIAGMHQT